MRSLTTGLLVGNPIMGGVQVNATGGTACLDATGNTLAPGQFDLEEAGGEISISQPDQGALSTENGGAGVTVAGTIDFDCPN